MRQRVVVTGGVSYVGAVLVGLDFDDAPGPRNRWKDVARKRFGSDV